MPPSPLSPFGTVLDLAPLAALPLWAQVLCAARQTRRAILWSPTGLLSATQQRTLLAQCDDLESLAIDGTPRVDAAFADDLPAAATALAAAVRWSRDAALAARDALDFSAAGDTCLHSAHQAVAAACAAPGMTAIQALIAARGDLNQLAFACAEAGVALHAPVGREVALRLAPVHPPDTPPPALDPMADDPTGGAR